MYITAVQNQFPFIPHVDRIVGSVDIEIKYILNRRLIIGVCVGLKFVDCIINRGLYLITPLYQYKAYIISMLNCVDIFKESY